MFKHICALNTYTEPFLAMKANDQRDFIEELLGITQLSTKSEVLKENNRAVKDQIKEEEYKIRSIKDSNDRIQNSIDDAIGRSKLWAGKHEGKKEQLTEALTELTQIDIDTEIKNIKRGKPAGIWLKMNSLVDSQMISKLYKASEAGVKIELFIRGICCLRPGVKKLSENIVVKSIVGRYLEHARIFCFANESNIPSKNNIVLILQVHTL